MLVVLLQNDARDSYCTHDSNYYFMSFTSKYKINKDSSLNDLNKLKVEWQCAIIIDNLIAVDLRL